MAKKDHEAFKRALARPDSSPTSELRAAAQIILSGLKLTPGGDAYTFEGSTNDVDWLREAVERLEAKELK